MKVTNFSIERFASEQNKVVTQDIIPIEEPLQLMMLDANSECFVDFAVLMRTPGNDMELVMGFLFSEGIITKKEDIKKIYPCSQVTEEYFGNTIKVIFKDGFDFNFFNKKKRNFSVSSSCGICGSKLIENIEDNTIISKKKWKDKVTVKQSVLMKLPSKIAQEQVTFRHTGGVHASIIFDLEGNFLCLMEDIGRHNALDKIIGKAILEGDIPMKNKILLLSGRVSYELVLKSSLAGICCIVALGAPSSLAIDTAKKTNITLVGFLKKEKFNLYSSSSNLKILDKI